MLRLKNYAPFGFNLSLTCIPVCTKACQHQVTQVCAGPNLSLGAWLRSLLTLTLFELDPGDQIAPNITCYLCTVAVDRTLWTTAQWYAC